MTAVIPITDTPVSRSLAMVSAAVRSPSTRRAYLACLSRFFERFPAGPVARATVQSHLSQLRANGAGPVSINQTLSALRKLAKEAAAHGYMDPREADAIAGIEGDPRRGVRSGNWLSLEQARNLIDTPDNSISGLRDRALFALLLGGALRREEAARLEWSGLDYRAGRYCVVDLIGKHGRVRTVPLPEWAVNGLSAWQAASEGVGCVLRAFSPSGSILGQMSADGVWWVVRQYGRRLGVNLAPHDLRRTAAHLMLAGGAPIQQISLTLGHASIVTTQRYINLGLDLRQPATSAMGL